MCHTSNATRPRCINCYGNDVNIANLLRFLYSGSLATIPVKMVHCNAGRVRCTILILFVAIVLLGAHFKFKPRFSLVEKDGSEDSQLQRGKPSDRDNYRSTSPTDVRVGTEEISVKGGGYVLSWDFCEGQTSAARNLLALVHWAGDMNLTVVEPCVHNSYFNLANCIDTAITATVNEFSSSSTMMPLLFGDYFDVDYWNHQTSSKRIGKPLLPWKEFINDKPNEAIMVYTWVVVGKDSTVFIDNEIERDAVKCYPNQQHRHQFSKETFYKLGITIIREVCFRFDLFVPMDLTWFNRQILGNHSQSSRILILFASWSGTFNGRMYLNKPEYHHDEAFDYIKPSSRVVRHSKKYTQMFLKGGNYVAVIVRTIKLAIGLKDNHGMSQEAVKKFIINTCSDDISTALKKVKDNRLLALDLGRFGDGDTSLYLANDTVDKTVHALVSTVYGNTWNRNQWEDSFVQATGGITDAGYIAMMQKVLVSNAACILMGGDGQFLNSLKRECSSKTKDYCIHEVCKPPNA